MKERPILFRPPMVRGILSGQKDTTRRIMDPQPPADISLPGYYGSDAPRDELAHTFGWFVWEAEDLWPCNVEDRIKCKQGKKGDQLWVKETHVLDPNADDSSWSTHEFSYQEWSGCGEKIKDLPEPLKTTDSILYTACRDLPGIAKRPSIFMPRWASRIQLEITNIRAERLQDITDEQCIKEGIESENGLYKDYLIDSYCHKSPKESFASLWLSINGPDSWFENPWVWVIEFKVLSSFKLFTTLMRDLKITFSDAMFPDLTEIFQNIKTSTDPAADCFKKLVKAFGVTVNLDSFPIGVSFVSPPCQPHFIPPDNLNRRYYLYEKPEINHGPARKMNNGPARDRNGGNKSPKIW